VKYFFERWILGELVSSKLLSATSGSLSYFYFHGAGILGSIFISVRGSCKTPILPPLAPKLTEFLREPNDGSIKGGVILPGSAA
jgi:hypothetical protein